MNLKTCLIIFSCLIFTNIALAQDRAPHGLAYETPLAFSPSAFDFFNTQPDNHDATLDTCGQEYGCSPLPLAAKVQGASAKAEQSEVATMSSGYRSGLGAGGVVWIIFGLAFAVPM